MIIEIARVDLIPRGGRGVGVGFSDNSWDGVGWENVGEIFKILKNAWDFPHANKSTRWNSGGNL